MSSSLPPPLSPSSGTTSGESQTSDLRLQTSDLRPGTGCLSEPVPRQLGGAWDDDAPLYAVDDIPEYPHAAGRSVSGGQEEAIFIVHCLLMSSPLNAFGQIRPVQNIRLAHECGRGLDPMWNVVRRESIGRETPRPPPFIAWSRTTSMNSSASGTSATKNSTDSGVPLSGTSSNSSWIVVI